MRPDPYHGTISPSRASPILIRSLQDLSLPACRALVGSLLESSDILSPRSTSNPGSKGTSARRVDLLLCDVDLHCRGVFCALRSLVERAMGAKEAPAQRERKGVRAQKGLCKAKPGGRSGEACPSFPERPLRGGLPVLRCCLSARFPVQVCCK